MRAVRDQLEKLVTRLVSSGLPERSPRRVSVSQLSTRAGTLEQARNELYVQMDMTHICQCNRDSGWACRENGAQEYSTGYAQDLDEIRALWMAIAQRREALTVRDTHAMFALP